MAGERDGFSRLRNSLANQEGVSEVENPITTRGRFSARAGGGGVVTMSR